MNLFDVYSLSHILHKFTQVEMGLIVPKTFGQGGTAVPEETDQRAQQAFSEAEMLFKAVEMPDCLLALRNAKHSWERPLRDVSSACEIAHRIQVDLISALENRFFLRVPDDRTSMVPYFRSGVPHLGSLETFGAEVLSAFESTRADVIEVGNCLAADCNTAAVFHLMRVVEVGLRALATDRGAVFANKPIELQEWGTILSFMDGAIKDLRSAKASNWHNSGVKDVQIRFYSEVVAELRQFNEAWRRHLSHAREDGIYDHNYANSVLDHVTKFMRKLAERISEHSITPQYWTQ